jgi:hypothetical protein
MYTEQLVVPAITAATTLVASRIFIREMPMVTEALIAGVEALVVLASFTSLCASVPELSPIAIGLLAGTATDLFWKNLQ